MPQSFFRKEALDAAQRIQSLPRSMRVAPSATRVAAGLLALSVAAAVGVSAMVVVPVTVDGHGVLIDRSETLIAPIEAAAQGRVAAVHVAVGDAVSSGDAVLTLRFPEREAQIARARAELESARRSADRRARIRAAEAEAAETAYARRREALDDRIAHLAQQVAWLRSRRRDIEGLAESGTVARPVVLEARLREAETEDQLHRTRADRTALDTQRAEAAGRRELAALDDALEIEHRANELAALEASVAADAVLRAAADGVVASVNTRRGALAEPGAVLVELLDAPRDAGSPADGSRGAAASPALEAVVFVGLADGKRVAPGDRVLLAPASLPEGEHDRLVGSVIRVSQTPASRAALTAVLGSDALVDQVAAAGPSFEVTVRLEPGVDGGGYRWTTESPPALALSAGTPLDARLTVERSTVLALAVPALKRLVGEDGDAWAGGR